MRRYNIRNPPQKLKIEDQNTVLKIGFSWSCMCGVRLWTGVAVGWSRRTAVEKQGPLVWCHLRPWNNARLTGEPCRRACTGRFIVINRILLLLRTAVGVPHPRKGRSPEDALRWVHCLLMSAFNWVDQGYHGAMAESFQTRPWAVCAWCLPCFWYVPVFTFLCTQ